MATLKHVPSFLEKEEAEIALNVLQALIPWTSFALSPNSRKVCLWKPGISDADSIVIDIKNKVERMEHVTIHGVFLNLYQNGNDYCPYHRDQYGTDVYTISLGATRDLLVKPDGKGETKKITLKSGDLYYMAEKLHADHKHSIPKRAGIHLPRISVVFFATKLGGCYLKS
jgi:alkylated DNA repair dioxygenase AlkB